jgi:hypothetical protein
LNSGILQKISIVKTPKEVWDKLEAHFADDGDGGGDLFDELAEVQFSWHAGLDQYVEEHLSLRDRIERAGQVHIEFWKSEAQMKISKVKGRSD